MNFRTLLTCSVAAALLILSGCDSPETASEQAVVEEAAPAAPAAADDAVIADTAATAEQAVAAVEETAGLDEEIEAAEEIELSEAAPAAVAAAPADWKYAEGTHFRRMTASQGTSSAPDKIEVAEVFWYGCPHCYDFDPILDEWKKSVAGDVSFVRIPVIWSPTHQQHARLMYTAEALGVLDQAHGAIFNAIHQQGNTLTREEDIVKLFESFGVDEAKFREAYGSFGVDAAVTRAENLTRRYGIRSVPIIVVDGKYVTEGTEIRGFGDIINVTNELIERERQDR